MMTPHRHPITQGPSTYPHPEPRLPQGADFFDAPQAPLESRPVGQGNMAQRLTSGEAYRPEEPPLPDAVNAWRKAFTVVPEEIK